MQLKRLKLPIGIQTFLKLRTEGCYYVDKTAFAWALTQDAGYYFLSRPRRFGKSLFLDTLKELYEGNEALFRGLFIHDKWDWSRRYPVVKITFSDGVWQSRAELEVRIHEILQEQASMFGVSFTNETIVGRFSELLRQIHQKNGERVVVLIDEYDKPILDNIAQSETALAMREGLKNLYSVLKASDADLQFVMLTGVSKFSKVSLFSGLNNLRDITLSPEYSAVCGYTDTDVDQTFAAELENLDRNEIRSWYNGYNWLGEAVYNPFDLLLLFRERKFRPWWFETATPTFLIKLLTDRKTWLPQLNQLETDADLLATFDVDSILLEALMFQSGYLTIDQEERISGRYYYRLRLPNLEVSQSLYGSLLNAWTPNAHTQVKNSRSLYRLLKANDFEGLKNLFTAFFSSIPHQWYANNPIARYEGYYASVFYSHFAALGLDITLEDTTNFGRIDMAVRFNGQIYLFEFKVVELAPQGKALQQIKAMDYAGKYRAEGEVMHLIGVEFSKETRSVVGFEVEMVGE